MFVKQFNYRLIVLAKPCPIKRCSTIIGYRINISTMTKQEFCCTYLAISRRAVERSSASEVFGIDIGKWLIEQKSNRVRMPFKRREV